MATPKIIVSNPCSKDWDKMDTTEQGKHCSSCSKTVTDFTQMQDEEIQHFFIDKALKKESVCGIIQKRKAEVKRPKKHQILVDWYARINANSNYFKTIRLSALAFCMTWVDCNKPTPAELKTNDTDFAPYDTGARANRINSRFFQKRQTNESETLAFGGDSLDLKQEHITTNIILPDTITSRKVTCVTLGGMMMIQHKPDTTTQKKPRNED